MKLSNSIRFYFLFENSITNRLFFIFGFIERERIISLRVDNHLFGRQIIKVENKAPVEVALAVHRPEVCIGFLSFVDFIAKEAFNVYVTHLLASDRIDVIQDDVAGVVNVDAQMELFRMTRCNVDALGFGMS